jgi:hypothetical protein
MHALARSIHAAPAAPSAPRRAHLRAVPAPAPRRAPRAAAVALYAMGLCAGFLLAALASAPGGAWVVTLQLQLALVAGTVCVLALARARAVARRRAARHPRTAPL